VSHAEWLNKSDEGHRTKSARPFANRSKPWTSNGTRPELGFQNAQSSYERYLALAKAQVQSGDMIGAEDTTTSMPNIILDPCRQTEKQLRSDAPKGDIHSVVRDPNSVTDF
jgi:hypothetical protein